MKIDVLRKRIEDTGLKPYRIHLLTDKDISVSQASVWLKNIEQGKSTSTIMHLLWRLCNENLSVVSIIEDGMGVTVPLKPSEQAKVAEFVDAFNKHTPESDLDTEGAYPDEGQVVARLSKEKIDELNKYILVGDMVHFNFMATTYCFSVNDGNFALVKTGDKWKIIAPSSGGWLKKGYIIATDK